MFEVHITGDASIHDICNGEIKTIMIDSIDKQLNFIKREHMTSHKLGDMSIKDMLYEVANIANFLIREGCHVSRIKIETPPRLRFLPYTIYVESHWEEYNIEKLNYPTSLNVEKSGYLLTDRLFEADKFWEYYIQKREEKKLVEFCIFDSNIDADFEWFRSWGF